ncbi:hypothetical protein [Sphingobacterium hungaricum]|uniref:Uncharacterized protein n=1 Tax=Sphingobacterium hungaricum TaxID=2082723 RepID=A0A928UY13_9SPHI|nr:hypothetical protein [Sphingobacterium hungaricum]MBE8712669.1 hypothetical protein [Sphingobacterium hungaricum]
MSKNRILSLIGIFTLSLQSIFAQEALRDAEKTLKDLVFLLDKGSILTPDSRFSVIDYNMTLNNDVEFIADHYSNGEAIILFKNEGKLEYTYKDNFYEFFSKDNEASITEEEGTLRKSKIFFKVEKISRVQADSIVLLFEKLSHNLKRVSEEKSKDQENFKANKKIFYETVKSVDADKYFINIPIPNTANRSFKSYSFFDNPLEINNNFYSGFKFTPRIDGYLYWYFNTVKGDKTSFYIVDLDKNTNDVDIPYFSKMSFHKGEDGESSYIIQKSNVKLKKGNTYILWFVSDTKPQPQAKNISIQMEESSNQILSKYFEDQFKSIQNDY